MSAMDFLSQTYIAIRGPTGAPQSPAETIAKLSDRLGPSTLLSDRRAAILALKGLARDHRLEVGERALKGLLEVLENDAEVDPDTALPVVETLNTLCDMDDPDHSARVLGYKHSDIVLENDKAVHKLLTLASQQSFYPRYATLKVLIMLLKHRRPKTQQYFLTAPTGAAIALAMLDDQREMMRNESLSFWEVLIVNNQDIQKVLAFQGAFEKLFNIVTSDGGIESRVNAQSALTCVDALLRFNSANQSYFRETPFPSLLLSLLLFPPDLPPQEPAPQQFALQFWDEIKQSNAALVVGMIGMLVATKGGKPQESWAFSRCLLELALASNAPTPIKAQALGLLPVDLDLPLSQMTVSPYMPVPDTNGEEWDRLESSSAFDALIELVLHGEYNGIVSANRSRDALDLRAAALLVFENFVNNDDIREAIIRSMLPRQDPVPIVPLLHCLIIPPSSPPDPANLTSTHFASLLFAHLTRQCPRAKLVARSIVPPTSASSAGGGDSLFVPADSSGQPQPAQPAPVEDDEPPQTLMQILCENLSLALISRPRSEAGDLPTRETREWDRTVVSYICLLSQWLWEDPKSVRDFLEAGGLGVLVEPIRRPIDGSDPIVPSLCAFLLGLCYEFNREPGEITRSAIHQIITRLSVDTLVSRIGSARDDVRMREVEPENFVLPYPTPTDLNIVAQIANEGEMWFDWHFVDFWKSGYYIIQKAVAYTPEATSAAGLIGGGSAAGGTSTDQETTMLLASLREVISNQAQEMETLQKKIKEMSMAKSEETGALKAQVDSLTAELGASEQKRKENEKEQEDLLVLLDELSSKRRRDKEKMTSAGLEVSEDEEEDEDGGDDEE